MDDAPPSPAANLKRKVLKDARVNNRQGEKPRGTSPGRLSKSGRFGKCRVDRRKEAKGARVRGTARNKLPAQVAKETSEEESSEGPTRGLLESAGGGRVQRSAFAWLKNSIAGLGRGSRTKDSSTRGTKTVRRRAARSEILGCRGIRLWFSRIARGPLWFRGRLALGLVERLLGRSFRGRA